jgi:hypothetical protein
LTTFDSPFVGWLRLVDDIDFVLSWLIRKLKPKIYLAVRLGVWSGSLTAWSLRWLLSLFRFQLVVRLVRNLHFNFLSVRLCCLNGLQHLYKNKTAGGNDAPFCSGSHVGFSTSVIRLCSDAKKVELGKDILCCHPMDLCMGLGLFYLPWLKNFPYFFDFLLIWLLKKFVPWLNLKFDFWSLCDHPGLFVTILVFLLRLTVRVFFLTTFRIIYYFMLFHGLKRIY